MVKKKRESEYSMEYQFYIYKKVCFLTFRIIKLKYTLRYCSNQEATSFGSHIDATC